MFEITAQLEAESESNKVTDWPMFRRDAANSGYIPQGNPLEKLTLNWQYETDYEVSASAIISEGTVFVASEDRHVYALDAESGDLQWTFKTNESIEDNAPAVLDETLFVASPRDKIYALDTESGEEIWSEDIGIHRTGITATNGAIYYTTPNRVFARNVDDGEELWQFSAYNASYSGPAVADGSVYFGTTEEKVYSLDAEDGTEEWVFRPFDWVLSTPVVADDTVYAGSNDDYLYAIDTTDGSQRWRYDVGHSVRAAPVVADGIVYISEGGTVALDPEDGTEIWSHQRSGDIAVVDDTVYLASGSSLYTHDTASGEKLAEYQLDATISTSLAISSDTIAFGSSDYSIYSYTQPDVGLEVTGDTVEVGGSATIDITANYANEVVVRNLWTDWTVDDYEDENGDFTDSVQTHGQVTFQWDSVQELVTPSVTVTLPDDYIGGTYMVDVTAKNNSNSNSDLTTIEIK